MITSYILNDYKGNCIYLNETIKFVHRGYVDEYPENSHQAIIKAFNDEYISEFDLRLTADDQIVIFHDSNIQHLSGIDKNIEDMNLSDIDKIIPISDGITKQTYISTFLQVLKTICSFKNVDTLFLDLKTNFPPAFEKDNKLINVMYQNINDSQCVNKKINYIISSSNPLVLNTVNSLFHSKYHHLGTLTTLWILGNSGYSIIDVFIYLLLRSRLWFYVFLKSPPNAVGFFYEFYIEHEHLMDSLRNDLGICTAFGINYLKTWKLGKTALDINDKIQRNNITVNLLMDHYDKDVWTQIIQKRYDKDPYVKYYGNNVEMIFIFLLTISMALFLHSILQII